MQEIIIIRAGGWAQAKQAGRLKCIFCCKKKVGTSVNEVKGGEREREREEIVVLFLNVPFSFSIYSGDSLLLMLKRLPGVH